MNAYVYVWHQVKPSTAAVTVTKVEDAPTQTLEKKKETVTKVEDAPTQPLEKKKEKDGRSADRRALLIFEDPVPKDMYGMFVCVCVCVCVCEYLHVMKALYM